MERCRATGVTHGSAEPWSRAFTFSNLLSGSVWGAGAFLADFSDMQQALITSMVLCAVMAAGCVLYAASLRAVLAFTLPMCGALLLVVWQDSDLHGLTWEWGDVAHAATRSVFFSTPGTATPALLTFVASFCTRALISSWSAK